jgi:hypothetical protein
VLLGIFPAAVIGLIEPVTVMLAGTPAIGPEGRSNWLLLAPISGYRASYSALIVLVVIVAVVLATIWLVRRFWHGRVRRATPWNCGFPLWTPRMQDTAEGFGQPIRQVFEPFFRMERELPSPFDAEPRYSVTIGDRVWHALYLPIAKGADAVARMVGLLQQGRISVYLTYSFITLLALLFFVQ